MELFFFLLVWAGLSFWVGHFAETRGRSLAGYFLLSFITSPLLGVIVVLVAKDLTAEASKEARRNKEHELQIEAIKAIAGSKAAPTSEDERQCPYCAETIKAAAKKCRHCGSDL